MFWLPNWVAETCRSNLNNNRLINEKLICAFRWSVLPSIMKMQVQKTKKKEKHENNFIDMILYLTHAY